MQCRSIHGHSVVPDVATDYRLQPVVTENPVRFENTQVPIVREIMVATTMSSLFVALFALVASSFRTRAGSARHGPPLAPQSFRLALDQEIARASR
jgi:hypothetical protein